MAAPSDFSGCDDVSRDLEKTPTKCILKRSISVEENTSKKLAMVDEMNIMISHPSGEDNSNLKADEPKTSSEQKVNEDNDEMDGGENMEKSKNLAMKDDMDIIIINSSDEDNDNLKVDEPKASGEQKILKDHDKMDGDKNVEKSIISIEKTDGQTNSSSESVEESKDKDQSPELSPKSKMAKEAFYKKRKEHYNEYKTAKLLAKELKNKDEEDNEDEEDDDDDDYDDYDEEDECAEDDEKDEDDEENEGGVHFYFGNH